MPVGPCVEDLITLANEIEYVAILTRQGKLQEAARAAEQWIKYNKSDQRALQVISAAKQAESGN